MNLKRCPICNEFNRKNEFQCVKCSNELIPNLTLEEKQAIHINQMRDEIDNLTEINTLQCNEIIKIGKDISFFKIVLIIYIILSSIGFIMFYSGISKLF